MDGDWVKVYRKILDSEVFANADLLKLWVFCLARANYKDTWVHIEGRTSPIFLERGQFITGRFALHNAYYPKPSSSNKLPLTVWRWLESLQTMGNVKISTNNKFSVVTVVNYGLYQSANSEDEQQMNNRRTTDEQQMNTEKKDKKVKKVKKKSAPAADRSEEMESPEGSGAVPTDTDGVPSEDGYSEPFAEWWKVYPRKVSKMEAAKAYPRAVKHFGQARGLESLAARVELLEITKAFAKTPKAKGEYCPYPATWLNQGRYDDDPAEWEKEGDDNGRGCGSKVRRDSPARVHSTQRNYGSE